MNAKLISESIAVPIYCLAVRRHHFVVIDFAADCFLNSVATLRQRQRTIQAKIIRRYQPVLAFYSLDNARLCLDVEL
jgi:hypothetical protein